MRFKRRVVPDAGLRGIQVIALMTVVFLLAMAFLFFSAFGPAPGIPLAVFPPSPFFRPGDVEVTLSLNGMKFVDGREIDDKQLDSMLKALAYRDPAVLIRSSKDAPVSRVAEIWRACENAGIRRVSLATD